MIMSKYLLYNGHSSLLDWVVDLIMTNENIYMIIIFLRGMASKPN